RRIPALIFLNSWVDQAASAVRNAFVAADHGAEKQQDQHPPDQLKRQHRISPSAIMLFLLIGCVGYQRRFNSAEMDSDLTHYGATSRVKSIPVLKNQYPSDG